MAHLRVGHPEQTLQKKVALALDGPRKAGHDTWVMASIQLLAQLAGIWRALPTLSLGNPS
jgi:hypothetical protein